jgi:hypothetical protein
MKKRLTCRRPDHERPLLRIDRYVKGIVDFLGVPIRDVAPEELE